MRFLPCNNPWPRPPWQIVAPDAVKKGLPLYYTSRGGALSLLGQLMADPVRVRQVRPYF